MYLNHYNLKLMPFEESPDPKFFWLSETHKEALACLIYCILENKAFLLLTGDIGIGKTSLINYLLLKNETDTLVINIANPDLSIPDFYKLLSRKLKFNKALNTKGDFLIQFKDFLYTAYSEGKKVILIIDEAQRLNQELIEQIRLLSNIERMNANLISIFFVGQDELIRIIKDKKNRALCQRVSVHHAIKPLTESETHEYIIHRLGIAGSKNEIFSNEAVNEIYSFSKGYPRLINNICDRSLLTGYVTETKRINRTIVKQCADELKSFISIQRKMKNKNEIKQTVVNNHNYDKVTLYRRTINKSSNEDLIVDLEAIKPDMIEEAINELIKKVKCKIKPDELKTIFTKFKNEDFIDKTTEIDFKHGDIVANNGQVAFKLDFKISYDLSLLLDREGKMIDVFRSSIKKIEK